MVEVGKIIKDEINVTKELHFLDYIFEIDHKDINKVELTYYYEDIGVSIYEDGKKVGETDDKILTFELAGENKEGKPASVQFNVKTTIEDLEKYDKNKVIDITDLLDDFESFLTRPGEKSECLYFGKPTNTEEDMRAVFPNLFLFRKDDEYQFKLVVPGDQVFLFFKIKFDK